MKKPLHRFHTFQHDFFLRQAGKRTEEKANSLRPELVKKRKVDDETNAETWTPSKQRCKMNGWLEYISHKIDVSNELDAKLIFPKINLMSDWVELIR